MAGKRSRRFNRKRGNKKRRFVRKRRMSNPLRMGIPNTQRKFAFQMQSIVDVGVAGAGIAYAQYIFPLNFPGMGVLDLGAGSANYQTLPNLPDLYDYFFGNNVDNIWDQYKVQMLHVKFIPSWTTTLDSNDYVTSPVPRVIYHYNDLDDYVLSVPATAELDYLDAGVQPKGFANARTLDFYLIQRNANRKFYLNSSNVRNARANVPSDTSDTPFPSPFASMKLLIVTDANPTPSYIGRMYVTWHCIAKGLKTPLVLPANFSSDVKGDPLKGDDLPAKGEIQQ